MPVAGFRAGRPDSGGPNDCSSQAPSLALRVPPLPQEATLKQKDDQRALLDALYELVQALAKQVDELAERVRQLESK